MALFGILLGEYRKQACCGAVGDELLCPIDNVLIPLEHGGGTHTGHIRSRPGLGQAKCGQIGCGGVFWEEFLFKLWASAYEEGHQPQDVASHTGGHA